ncbi:MAG: hypothetical protein HW421_1101 [Ignavibacteria bacterium]|nr:hypothetical protein [Ignavibacteria bacterium]
MKKYTEFFLLILFLFYIIGCSDSSQDNSPVNINGTWSGEGKVNESTSTTIILTLIDSAGKITGTAHANIRFATVQPKDTTYLLTGTLVQHTLILYAKDSTHDATFFNGTVSSDSKSITGTVNMTAMKQELSCKMTFDKQ